MINLAHSPDADDIFMYYAIKFGWISTPDRIENVAEDIETLNIKTLEGVYDVCAISFALYPHVKNSYALLKTAVSFGEGYGPKLIKKKGAHLKRRFKVALSGKYTTNALLFRIAYPDARPVYMNFMEIEKAVVEGVVDAGVLIHESILNFDESLEVEAEIWNIWSELNKKELPLPLGGMAIRRSIPLLKSIEIEKSLIKAVEVAHTHKYLLSRMLLQRDLVRVDSRLLNTYLTMYANENSIVLNDNQLEALDMLFDLGYRHGFYEAPCEVKDFMIPDEYTGVRFS